MAAEGQDSGSRQGEGAKVGGRGRPSARGRRWEGLGSDRDGVIARLREAGIGAQIHYPIPIHLQEAYRSLDKPAGSFPVTEQRSREILSLPLCPCLGDDGVTRVVETLRVVLADRDLRRDDHRSRASR